MLNCRRTILTLVSRRRAQPQHSLPLLLPHHHSARRRLVAFSSSTEDDRESASNPGLASIIAQGRKVLDQTADDIQYKTRKSTLLRPHKKKIKNPALLFVGDEASSSSSAMDSKQNEHIEELILDMNPRQLEEGQRIVDVASSCLDVLAYQYEENKKQPNSTKNNTTGQGNKNGLILFGEPITILECIVDRNLRQAKVYWSLPYSILIDERITQTLYQKIVVKVQDQLVHHGGAKVLSKLVHHKLSYYYPPKLKLYPATNSMVNTAIEEIMG